MASTTSSAVTLKPSSAATANRSRRGVGLILDSSVAIAAERRGDTVQAFLQRVIDTAGDQEAALSPVLPRPSLLPHTRRGGCILRCVRTPWCPRCRGTNLSVKQVMTRLSLEIELPDTLAKQAQEAGLLEPDAVERMVREALLARRVESLAQARDVLAANPLPPMTLARQAGIVGF